MVNWTPADAEAYEQRRSRNPDARIRPAYQEPDKRNALELPPLRKEAGGPPPAQRVAITFIVYSTRPGDWDGYHVKELQDMLVQAGILSGDDWASLQGTVISRKAVSKGEERTEIVIEQLQ